MREVYEVRAAAADGLLIPAGPWRGGDAEMNGSKQQQVSELLHEAAETHHRVFRIVDGADDDWATWYADWLVNLSELPALLGAKPARSEPWEPYYAHRIIEQLAR